MYLSRLCTDLGMVVSGILLLPDDHAIAGRLRDLIGVEDLVIVTGGLGPTSDDITREIVAEAAGVELQFREDVWDTIRSRFRRRAPADSNRKQAEIPVGFHVIDNEWGTAPGFYGHVGRSLIVVLPGPPSELIPMCRRTVRPMLEKFFCVPVGHREVLTCFLIPESSLEEIAVAVAVEGVRWSTRAEGSRIVVTLTGGADDAQATFVQRIRRRIGSLCFAPGETSANELLLSALRLRGLRLCTAESCTGGLLAKLLTDVPGSSEVVWGGFVTYDNDAKKRLLGVTGIERYGAVSREVVAAMARGALDASEADVALAVSGVAGPGGGSPDKPVGTVHVAVARRGAPLRTFRLSLHGDRERIRSRSAVATFLLARGVIEEKDVDTDPLWDYI